MKWAEVIDENAEEIATLDAINAGKLYHTIQLRLMKFPQQKIPSTLLCWCWCC